MSSNYGFPGLHFSIFFLQGTWSKWPVTTMAVRYWRRGCPMVRSAKFVDASVFMIESVDDKIIEV